MHRHGLSYVEVLMATIVMSVLLVAALRLFGNLGRSQKHLVDADLAGRLAIEMIEEIRHQDYRDPSVLDEFGPGPDEETGTREAFDDIDDYHEWASQPPQGSDGKVFEEYETLRREVKVQYVSLDDLTKVVEADEGAKCVHIFVYSNSQCLAEHEYVIVETD